MCTVFEGSEEVNVGYLSFLFLKISQVSMYPSINIIQLYNLQSNPNPIRKDFN
jgi:hypothetical protein